MSRTERSRRTLTMSKRIFAVMLAFVAFVLALLWIFQVLLLEDIYENIRIGELKRAARRIEASLESEDIENILYNISSELNVCISIYDISGKVGKLEMRSHIDADCLIHNIVYDNLLKRLYSEAQKRDYYIERVAPSEQADHSFPETVIMSRVASVGDSGKMILINAEIEPVEATKNTLVSQLALISVILVAVATVLTFVISRHLARPIAAMNREAAKLSRGDYDVKFDGGGSRETEELADTLNYAASELSKTDKLQRELIANISHDLRTPLTMISGFSEVIRDIPGEATPENMQIIIDETNRLASLVNDMLDLSRLTSGSKELKLECFSLRALVEETLTRYTKLKERDGYKFIFDSADEYLVEADKGRILQVIYNLINNAVNYCGDDKLIIIRQFETDSGNVRTEVTDHGVGIAEDQLPYIWDRYYRANDFHKRAAIGTGLGLSIAKGVLELHGASYGVISRQGEGSTFYFELPIVCRRSEE